MHTSTFSQYQRCHDHLHSWLCIVFLVVAGMMSTKLVAVSLISQDTIALQKNQTHVYQESSKVPILIRQSPGSEIIELRVNFNYGFKDAKGYEKVSTDLMFDILTKASKNYSKQQVFALLDRFSAGISCSFGIEFSSCSLSTIARYFDELLPVFIDLLQNPLLSDDDFQLSRKAQIAAVKAQMQDPAASANEAANEIFYPKNHPYYTSSDQKLQLLESINTQALAKTHAKIMQQHLNSIVVVASVDPNDLAKKLRDHFQSFSFQPEKVKKAIPDTNQSIQRNLVFQDRKIPTAYIRIKMQMPGFTHADSVAANFMMKVLDEELGLEIRTRRSLSYAVFSYVIDYQLGIGIIGVTTSKPKETLAAINTVLKRFKAKPFASENDLVEHQTVYTTNYFLDLEDHASIAASLSAFWYFHRSVDRLYDSPLELAKVQVGDVARVARSYLRNFKVGVVFDRSRFQDKWVEALVESHR